MCQFKGIVALDLINYSGLINNKNLVIVYVKKSSLIHMKILHFGKYYPPYFGGVEKVNYDIVESLNRKEECQVDELCFAHAVGYEESFVPNGYKVIRVPIWGIKYSTPLPKGILKAFLSIRKDYDIVHVHVPNPIASIVSLLTPRKVKIVVHWHSDIIKQKALLKLFRPFQTAFLKRADAIIATSQNYVDASEDLRPYVSKTHVIPIGLDEKEMNYKTEDVEAIRKEYDGKKIVLCIGRLTMYKGHHYLIEAANHLPEDTVVLIGGVGELEAELKEQVRQQRLENKVFFIGRIPQEKIYAYYKAADVFCIPSTSRAEAFGVVLLEALAMGTPIVTCNIQGSGVPWVNQDGETGFNVEPKNSKELAEKLNLLLSDDDLRVSMSEKCHKRFMDHFALDKMVEGTYKLYKSLF